MSFMMFPDFPSFSQRVVCLKGLSASNACILHMPRTSDNGTITNIAPGQNKWYMDFSHFSHSTINKDTIFLVITGHDPTFLTMANLNLKVRPKDSMRATNFQTLSRHCFQAAACISDLICRLRSVDMLLMHIVNFWHNIIWQCVKTFYPWWTPK